MEHKYLKKVVERLRATTSEFGLVQHSELERPDTSFDYSIDDSARALVILSRYSKFIRDESLAKVYLNYLIQARRDDGWYENYRRQNGEFGRNGKREKVTSLQDCFGRTLWALAEFYSSNYCERLKGASAEMFDSSLAKIDDLVHPMSLALSGIGISKYLSSHDCLTTKDAAKRVADNLLSRFNHHRAPDWKGFDSQYSYCAARLPNSMILLGERLKEEKYIEAGLKSLDFLIEKLFDENGVFHGIGNGNPATNANDESWFKKGREIAVYDEQTIEAGAMVEACKDAFLITGNEKYLTFARFAFEWFLGKNIARRKMVKENGAVYDAITGPTSVNENCGAESLISWGLALSCLDTLQ